LCHERNRYIFDSTCCCGQSTFVLLNNRSFLCLSILAHLLFADLFTVDKRARLSRVHSGSPRRAFTHCEVFVPAAPRRACIHVSECISGPSLSRPVRIIGMLGSYPNISLIRRSPILFCLTAFNERAFQHQSSMGYYAQYWGSTKHLAFSLHLLLLDVFLPSSCLCRIRISLEFFF